MIFDDVCHDRSMSRAPREIGQPRTIALDTVCPLDGSVLDDARDCPTCPPEMRGAARRVIEIRRAAFEPVVVVRVQPSRTPPPGQPSIRLAPLVQPSRVPRMGRA